MVWQEPQCLLEFERTQLELILWEQKFEIAAKLSRNRTSVAQN